MIKMKGNLKGIAYRVGIVPTSMVKRGMHKLITIWLSFLH